jgi:phage portal protein BeeE
MAQIAQRRNVFSRVFAGIGSMLKRAGGRVLAWGVGVMDVWASLGSHENITEGYAKTSAIFALINKDAAKFAQVKRYVYDLKAKENEEGRKVKVNGEQYRDLLNLINNPNPYQTQSEFYEAVRIMYKCTKEAFVWLNRGNVAEKLVDDGNGGYAVDIYGQLQLEKRSDEEQNKMPVLEMYVLPSPFVNVIPDPDNVFGYKGFTFEVAGKLKYIRKEDMIYWRGYNPKFDATTGSHLRGLSAIEVAACDIAEFKEIQKSSLRMHKNDGAKGVLTNKGYGWNDLDEQEQAAIMDTVQNRLNGNDVKGAVAFLGGDWDYKEIAKSSVDLETLDSKKFKWKELMFMFDLPFGLFDNDGKYSNAPEWPKQWVQSSIMPDGMRFDEKLTKALATAFRLEGAVEINGDYMSLPELQKNLKELAEAFNLMWYVSPNRKLVAMGFEPVPNPLFNEPWVGMGLTPLSQYGQEQTFQNESEKLEEDDY